MSSLLSSSEILKLMRKKGAIIKRSPGSDVICAQWRDNSFMAFEVAEGLEAWTVSTAKALNIEAEYHYTTAGGSGFLRSRVEMAGLLPSMTPDKLDAVKKNLQCGISKSLGRNYQEVVLRRCQGSIDSRELCWQFWLGGHTSTSRGFSPEALENNVDEGYWVSARVEIWSGFFVEERKQFLQLGTVVLGSVFARAPASETPTSSQYQTIDQFEPGVDIYDIDDLLNFRLDELLRKDGLTCQ